MRLTLPLHWVFHEEYREWTDGMTRKVITLIDVGWVDKSSIQTHNFLNVQNTVGNQFTGTVAHTRLAQIKPRNQAICEQRNRVREKSFSISIQINKMRCKMKEKKLFNQVAVAVHSCMHQPNTNLRLCLNARISNAPQHSALFRWCYTIAWIFFQLLSNRMPLLVPGRVSTTLGFVSSQLPMSYRTIITQWISFGKQFISIELDLFNHFSKWVN